MHRNPSSRFLFQWLAAGAWTAFAAIVPAYGQSDEPGSPTVELPALLVAPGDVPPSARFGFTGPTLEPAASAGNWIDFQQPGQLTNRTLADFLAEEPGILARDFLGGNDQPLLSIRGSGAQSVPSARGVTLFLDGIPWQRADGEFVLGSLDFSLLSQALVWRGADALAHGGTTLGGLADFRSLGTTEAPAYLLHAAAGSYDFSSLGASIAFDAGDFLARTSLSFESSKGFRTHNYQQRTFAHQAVTWKPSETQRLDVFVTLADQVYEVPGGLNASAAETDPRGVSPGLVPGQNAGPAILRDDPERDYTLGRLAARWSAQAGNIEAAISAYVLGFADDFRRPIGFGFEKEDSWSFGLNTEATTTANLLGRHQIFTLRAQGDALRADNAFYHNDHGRQGDRFSENNLEATQATLALNGSTTLTETLSLLMTLQLQYASRESNDTFSQADRPTLQTGPVPTPLGGPTLPPSFPAEDTSFDWNELSLNPRIALRWEPLPELLAYLSLSRATEAPTLSDFFVIRGGSPNGSPTTFAAQNLDPQVATTLEAGLRWKVGLLTGSVATYRSVVEDELIVFNVSGGDQTINASSDVIHQGIELGVTWEIANGLLAEGDGLTISGAYTLNDFTFDGDPAYGENEVAGQPRQVVAASLRYAWSDRFGTSLSLLWQPEETFIDHANTASYDGFARLDWQIHAMVARGVTVFGEIRNLTNETYTASSLVVRQVPNALQANRFPGAARNVVIGLSWKL